MSKIITGRQEILIGHVCSKCGTALVHKCTLYTDGRANAFFHEKDKAEHAREVAYSQAMRDIAVCYDSPRQLGSMTQVDPGENREWAFYKIEQLDSPCTTCGHVEGWQLGKKSAWNPVDVPFQQRDRIANVPVESRPVVLDSKEAVASWLGNPANKEKLEHLAADRAARAEAQFASGIWVCNNCGSRNNIDQKYCPGCNVSKAWSDERDLKKK